MTRGRWPRTARPRPQKSDRVFPAGRKKKRCWHPPARAVRAGAGIEYASVFGTGWKLGQAFDLQRVEAPAICAQDQEAQAIKADGLATFGQVTKVIDDQPGDGIEFFIGKRTAQGGIQIVDRGHSLDAPMTRMLLDNVVFLF